MLGYLIIGALAFIVGWFVGTSKQMYLLEQEYIKQLKEKLIKEDLIEEEKEK